MKKIPKVKASKVAKALKAVGNAKDVQIEIGKVYGVEVIP